MKPLSMIAVALILAPLSRPGLAQTSAVPLESNAPPPSTGFQMAIRTGAMIPFGNVAKSSGKALSMGDAFSVQVPILVELGGKPIPNLFVGGYIGIGIGGAAGETADSCSRKEAGCIGTSARLGAEIQYHMAPGDKINPWVGYGIGFEAVAISGDSRSGRVRNTFFGPEFAHFMGGLDFRLSKTLGIGPLVDLSIARFTEQSIESGGSEISGSIDDDARATHFWLTLGGRLVIFP